MLGMCRNARLQRVRPADPLQPGRDLGVIEVGMVAAAGADELKCAGVAAFHPAVHDADRLAPQACGPAMARLASKRQRHDALIVNAQPRVTGMTLFARRGDGAQMTRMPRTCHDIQVSGATHSARPKPGLVVADVIVVSYAGLAGTSVPLLTCTIDCTSRELAWHPPNEVKGDEAGPSLVEEAEIVRPGDCLAAGGGAQLAVDRVRL